MDLIKDRRIQWEDILGLYYIIFYIICSIIIGFHCGEVRDRRILGCDTIWSCR
jgi:hypothetical protein